MLATFVKILVCFSTFINFGNACSNSCVCVTYKATCANPRIADIVLTEDIREVTFTEFDAGTLVADVFNAPQWRKVLKLDINANKGTVLSANVFNGLTNLTYIGFHNAQMFTMSRDAFYGLENVRVLDFSGNRRLGTIHLFQSLYTSYLPKLTHLTLTGLHSYYVESIQVDDSFFGSIFGNGIHRNIMYLDISNISVGNVDYNAGINRGFCDSVEHIVARKCSFQNIFGYNFQPTCTSLKIIDFGESFVPSFAYGPSFTNTDFTCIAAKFYFNVEEMYMNSFAKYVITPPFVENYFLDLSPCAMKIRKVSLFNIQAVKFNMTIALHNVTEHSMESLNLADNILEYINPGFLKPSKYLKYVDFSNNQLHKMQNNYGQDFGEIIKENFNLEIFKMAFNGLKSVPKNMFKANAKIKYIDLSNNKLSAIGFDIGHIDGLRELNLSGNKFTAISATERNMLSAFALGHANSLDFRVDLSNMSYVCSCESENLETVKWIYENMHTFLSGNKDDYKCTLKEQKLVITDDAYAKTTAYCTHRLRIKIISITIPVIAVCILSVAFALVKFRNVRRKKQERNDVIHDIQMERFSKKLIAFLSFCSEDADLVLDKIIPNLNTELQALTGSCKQMICSGDRQFRPGHSLGEEIIRCIEESAVIILAVSKSFCSKEWCRKEVQETYDQNKPIVLLLLEKVEPDEMGKVLRKLFSRYAHASWIPDTNGGHIEPEWTVFCNALLDLTVKEAQKHQTERPGWFNCVNF